jgi:glycosyltransferase involved in cell wall biosynthesis
VRILLVSQYFWPENFKINDLCVGLQERGHEITILTGKPNYPGGKLFDGYGFFNKRMESWNGMKIHRSWLWPRKNGAGINLMLNYFTFAILASVRVLFIKGKFDRILVYEPSPITVGFPGIAAKWRFNACMYFWVQDLWPASIAAAGGLNNKFILKLMDRVTRFIYHHSHKVLVQSKAFVPYILNQEVQAHKLIYYPNSTESYYNVQEPSAAYATKLPTGIKLMFAGNIGEAQSFDTIINAAIILKNKQVDVKWVILGNGRMREYVEKRVFEAILSDSFFLMGSFPSTEMPQFFSCADALIVSLKRDPIFAYTIPSKVQSYMACGKPLIASLDGEGAAIILEAKAGFTAPSEDAEKLAEAVIAFIGLTETDRAELGRNARTYFEKEFERELLLDKLEYILKD